METAANRPARQTPDYTLAADCLTSLFDAVSKLVSTAARGKQYSKSDLMEATGLVQMTRNVVTSCCVDLTGAFDPSIGGPDSKLATRALLALNERLLRSMKALIDANDKHVDARRAFDRFEVREMYALAMTFAQALGVKVEG